MSTRPEIVSATADSPTRIGTTHAIKASAVLLLPGWKDSGRGHWQTCWEARHGDRRVVQADWLWPRRGDWMARLDDVLLAEPRPVRLAAHSLGCHLVAAWAAHSRHTARVHGALLVAPPDLERPDLPPQLAPWRPVVRRRLPFPAVAVLSDDDPFGSLTSTRRLVEAWGCDPVRVLPGAGHLNADTGLGDWPEGRGWLDALPGGDAVRSAPG